MKVQQLAAVLPGLIAAEIAQWVLNLGVLSVVYLPGGPSHGSDALLAFRGSMWHLVFNLITASLAIGVGGLTATWLAKDESLRTALALAVAVILLSLVSALFRPPATSWWIFAGSLVLVVPAAIVGGHLGRRRA